MRSLTLGKLLFSLALLSLQGLAFAHEIQHPASDAQSHICQICAHGQPDNAVAPAATLLLAQESRDPLSVAALPQAPSRRTHSQRIRAPPVHSC